MQTEKNTNNTNEYKPYFDLLDTMQGGMNMYGAPSKLRQLHPELGKRESVDVVAGWMQSKTTDNA